MTEQLIVIRPEFSLYICATAGQMGSARAGMDLIDRKIFMDDLYCFRVTRHQFVHGPLRLFAKRAMEIFELNNHYLRVGPAFEWRTLDHQWRAIHRRRVEKNFYLGFCPQLTEESVSLRQQFLIEQMSLDALAQSRLILWQLFFIGLIERVYFTRRYRRHLRGNFGYEQRLDSPTAPLRFFG